MNNDIRAVCGNWAYVGMTQGLGRGVVLAYGYIALPILFALIAFMWQFCMELNTVMLGGYSRLLSEPTALFWAVGMGFVVLVFYVGFGTVLGVIPAAIVGMVSGGIIGAVLALPHIAPYRWNRLAVGVGMGLVIAALVNQAGMWAFLHQANDGMGAYLFFIMGPSLFYVGFCAWLSDQFPTLVTNLQHAHEFPVRERLPKHVIPE